jgi:predicted kinase
MSAMPTVTICKGLPASGKSTWAREQLAADPHTKRVNKDELRAMLDASRHTKANERFVEALRDHIVLTAVAAGHNVIVDDTNLAPRHEAHLRKLLAGKAVVVVRWFEIELDDAIRRDLARATSVGERAIRRMWSTHIAPTIGDRVERDASLPPAIMVDLDGTLALIDHRNPYDAAQCEDDAVNEVVRSIASHHEHVLLVSGRDAEFRPHTERWLARHAIPYTELHMRAAGDRRKDSIVKRELFDAHVRGRWDIAFVLDDRNQVVDMWRALGLTCLQVAPGDF